MNTKKSWLVAEAPDRVALRKRLLKLIDQISNKEIDIAEAAEITNAAGKYCKSVQLEIMAQMVTNQTNKLQPTTVETLEHDKLTEPSRPRSTAKAS